MGACLEKLGKLKQARDVFNRIHTLRPYFMNVDERIDAIDRKGEETHVMHDLLVQEAEFRSPDITDTFLVRVGERYTDLEELGRGGAGIVFRARDKLLDRAVALKQLPSAVTSDPVRLKAFFKEARAIAKLNHPNIVMIHDIMKSGSDYFIVMEFIDGVTVEKLLETKGALSLKFSLYIARHVLMALAYAHRCAVVHQDIKPANIMLTVDRTVKLTDFGIAHLRDELPDHSPELVMGTPKYISPEQLRGVPVDERCDIYSFGVTFYEMLTGNLPFPTDGILHHHLVTPPTPLRAYQPGYSEELEEIVMKCLEKDRDNRFLSTAELHDALKRYQKKIGSTQEG
jgi:serine/threonine protein kinase